MDEDAVEVERSVEGQPVPVIRGTSLDRAYLQGATGNFGRSQLRCCSTHECRAESNVGLTCTFGFMEVVKLTHDVQYNQVAMRCGSFWNRGDFTLVEKHILSSVLGLASWSLAPEQCSPRMESR